MCVTASRGAPGRRMGPDLNMATGIGDKAPERAPIMHTAGSAAARPARQLLGASDLQALFAGHTLYAESWHRFPVYDRGPVHLYLAAGGRLFGTSPEGVDVGTWHITPDGQWCRTWYV